MERVEAVGAAAQHDVAPGPADSLASPSLASLYSEYNAAGVLSGGAQLVRLVTWFETAPPTDANAKELLALLDADAFSSVTDAQGRPLKALALLTLLRFGYPWALQVKPDDLAWLREEQRPFWRKNLKGIVAIGLWVILAAEVATFTFPLWWPLW
jgi:hypothetical protein